MRFPVALAAVATLTASICAELINADADADAHVGGDVGVDDGKRPFVLFFCLSWFQKKKKPSSEYDEALVRAVFNEFFNLEEAAEPKPPSGEPMKENANSLEETVNSVSGEQLEESVNAFDDSTPYALFEFCINNLGETYNSSSSGESLNDV
ncbi:uncharacterized protein EDB93DRAFT_1327632 [Suillus bovinus]|uniref:uncharacterized protein n=1 Tax=Suillus bovinus TaxID=48563 RepID=UPI001B87F0AA|nr:uncharacterized protein EDB93DRAFT_1327632 [Suillus bovinus]KAG2151567.1 hypothetical protein EDB93DRAFT_1327632 [Suillus bovinus]